MKTSDEKEKKLNLALSKLKKLNFENPDLKNSIEKLNIQKNQLEIEKKEIETRYQNLIEDHDKLNEKLEKMNKQKFIGFIISFLIIVGGLVLPDLNNCI